MSTKQFLPLIILLFSVTSAHGQEIRVVKNLFSSWVQPKADEIIQYDSWTVSHSRRRSPDTFELDGVYSTFAAAQAEAQSLIAWSNRIESPGWKLAIIKIEGEPKTVKMPSHEQGSNDFFHYLLGHDKQKQDEILRQSKNRDSIELPDIPLVSIPGDLRLEKDPTIPGSVLNEYQAVVTNSWKNAKTLKGKLSSLLESVPETELETAENLVDDLMKQEPALFLEKARTKTMRVRIEGQQAKVREDSKQVSELLERIARTADPKEQQRLLEQSAAIDKLRQNVEETGELRKQQIDYEERKKTVDTLENTVAQNKVKLIEWPELKWIDVDSTFGSTPKKTESPKRVDVETNGKPRNTWQVVRSPTKEMVVGTWSLETGGIRHVFAADGTMTWFGSGFAEQYQWFIDREGRVVHHDNHVAHFKWTMYRDDSNLWISPYGLAIPNKHTYKKR